MAISIGSAFSYHAKRFLDERQGLAKTKADLKSWVIPVPEGFEVFLLSDKSWYEYSSSHSSPETGKFKPRNLENKEQFDKLTQIIEELKAAIGGDTFKGMYPTEEKLKEAHPNPKLGDWALVGDSLPAPIYIVSSQGEWIASGAVGTPGGSSGGSSGTGLTLEQQTLLSNLIGTLQFEANKVKISKNVEILGDLEVKGSITTNESYNRVQIWPGLEFHSTCSGVVDKVNEIANTLTLKCLEEESIHVKEGDLCMGVYYTGSTGSLSNEDNGMGVFSFKGFSTIYFRIVSVNEAEKTIIYSLRPGTTEHPKPGLVFAGRGNDIYLNRQSFRYETPTYHRIMVGVDDWNWSQNMIAGQSGSMIGLPETVTGSQGNLTNVTHYFGDIYIGGKVYGLNQLFSTLFGSANVRCVIESTNGNEFGDVGWKTKLKAYVVMGPAGLVDKTNEVIVWTWTRKTGETQDHIIADSLWNEEHKHFNNREIEAVVGTDIPLQSSQCIFTCSAKMPDKTIIGGVYEIDVTN